jgi:hypothetical protein
MLRYCSVCDQTFGTSERSLFSTQQSPVEKTAKTCEESGYGDCAENSFASAMPIKEIPKQQKSEEKPEPKK